jgi:hypothetical protein
MSTFTREGPATFQFKDPSTGKYLILDADGSFHLKQQPNELARKSYYYVLPSASKSLIVLGSISMNPVSRRYLSLETGWTKRPEDTPVIRVVPGSSCGTVRIRADSSEYLHPPDAEGFLLLSLSPYEWYLESASSAFRMRNPKTGQYVFSDKDSGTFSLIPDKDSATIFQWFNGNIFRSGSLRFDSRIGDFVAHILILDAVSGLVRMVHDMPRQKWPLMFEDAYTKSVALAPTPQSYFYLSSPNQAGLLVSSLHQNSDTLLPVSTQISIATCMAFRMTSDLKFAHPGRYMYGVRDGPDCNETESILANVGSPETNETTTTTTTVVVKPNKDPMWVPLIITTLIILLLVGCALINRNQKF